MAIETDTVLPEQAPPKGGGMAIAALVLGVVGIVFGLIPLTAFLALICGVLALIFGIKGRYSDSPGMAKAGRILGALAIVAGVYGLYVMATVVEEFENDMEQIGEDFEAEMNQIERETEAEMERIEREMGGF